MKTLEAVLIDYQDWLRTWAIRNTVKAWKKLDIDDLDASFPQVARLSQAIYGAATARTMTTTDEFMALKAALGGLEYRATWMASERINAPTQLMSGAPYQEWMVKAPRAMKTAIKRGVDPTDAATISMKRTVNEVATSVYQRPRQTTWNRFLVDSIERRNWDIPEELRVYRSEVQTYPELWDGQSRREYKGTFERWRRVPSPGACEFCLMLATRTDYTSADAAMYVGGGEGQERRKVVGGKQQRSGVQRRRSSKRQAGDRYHRACRCTVAMATSGGRGSQGQSIQMTRAEYEEMLSRTNGGTISFNGYTYDLADVELLEGSGIGLPKQAPWKDAWKSAPRSKTSRR